jgi:hypothetical protein
VGLTVEYAGRQLELTEHGNLLTLGHRTEAG